MDFFKTLRILYVSKTGPYPRFPGGWLLRKTNPKSKMGISDNINVNDFIL